MLSEVARSMLRASEDSASHALGNSDRDNGVSVFLARIGSLGRLVLAAVLVAPFYPLVHGWLYSSAWKGHASSWLVWVVIGLVAGTVSMALDRAATRAQRCPHCREVVKHPGATACAHCGRDLSAAPAA